MRPNVPWVRLREEFASRPISNATLHRPPCSRLSRRALETPECASMAERRPTLTASREFGDLLIVCFLQQPRNSSAHRTKLLPSKRHDRNDSDGATGSGGQELSIGGQNGKTHKRSKSSGGGDVWGNNKIGSPSAFACRAERLGHDNARVAVGIWTTTPSVPAPRRIHGLIRRSGCRGNRGRCPDSDQPRGRRS
jgi:hypothetical protein